MSQLSRLPIPYGQAVQEDLPLLCMPNFYLVHTGQTPYCPSYLEILGSAPYMAVVDSFYLLSGHYPALHQQLALTTSRGLALLSQHPFFHAPVVSALRRPPRDRIFFLLDPSAESCLMAQRQTYGVRSLTQVFRFGGSDIWSMQWELNQQSNFIFV